MRAYAYLTLTSFAIFCGSMLSAMQSPDPNYQQINVLNLGDLMPKNEKELSNKELLEKAGFIFSGLSEETKKRRLIVPANESKCDQKGIQIPLEMLPDILQMVNNNSDTHAQKTQEMLDRVLTNLSQAKNPVVQQNSSWLKGIFSTLGLGGTSAMASGAICIGYVILTKVGWL